MLYKNKFSFIVVLLLISCFGFQLLEPVQLVYPESWPEPAYNFKANPLDANKILLGRHLYFDPILSRDSSISCSSCHLQYTAFTHVDHDLSHGIDDRIGRRNSPTLINLAWGKAFMWDGAVNHLDMQVLAPITNPAEMDESLENVLLKLNRNPKYQALFYKAFKDSVITGQHLLLAMSQFMLTMVSGNSKYDQVKSAKAVFTEQEQRGYTLFQKKCASCHSEPLFTNQTFMNNGLAPDADLRDLGRFEVTQNPNDSFLFKVPTLRNIEFSYPYMHDGRFKKISEVLKFYNKDGYHSSTVPAIRQKGMGLSEENRIDLIAFLLTLTDKEFLFDPKFSFPRDSSTKY